MAIINFENLPLTPERSRAARNYFGLSQAQTADQSKLPAHKLKRFESGNYLPDTQFLADLREFYEGLGYDFHDEDSPGAKAKAKGDVFPAGVVGETDDSPMKTGSSTKGKPGKLARPQTANLQFMRITPTLESDQVDRIFDCIEDNEAAMADAAEQAIERGFLSEYPTSESQAQALAQLRRLAENGLLYARLMGRDLVPAADADAPAKVASAKTVGDLLRLAMTDLQLAVIDGDKEATARRKGRAAPTEVLQALVG